ncbi:hypothetical protein [Cognatishimia sp. MH4019]|uniref:hypothetical protein n=1 Tax=Cognatishimia sp. MH4019 TaxID=2854030 RepID=UPI001CD6063B|nr:hypothetical protein [Cognatishimia sp. MH4019]
MANPAQCLPENDEALLLSPIMIDDNNWYRQNMYRLAFIARSFPNPTAMEQREARKRLRTIVVTITCPLVLISSNRCISSADKRDYFARKLREDI